VDNLPIWIQSSAAIVLVIVTIIYVIITHRILHSTYRAYLKPTEVSLDETNWKIIVRNFGPGLATNVEVKTIITTSWKFSPNSRSNKEPLIFITKELLRADGPFEIESYKDGEFSFINLPSFEYPFLISWRTITGGKQKSAWRILISHKTEVVPVNVWGRLRFRFGWICMNLKSPYHTLKKRWHFRKRKKRTKD
jgi:hypothetical protein